MSVLTRGVGTEIVDVQSSRLSRPNDGRFELSALVLSVACFCQPPSDVQKLGRVHTTVLFGYSHRACRTKDGQRTRSRDSQEPLALGRKTNQTSVQIGDFVASPQHGDTRVTSTTLNNSAYTASGVKMLSGGE